jgi:hypothetical protein
MLTVPATLESVDTEYLRLSFCHITAKQSTGQLLNFVVLPRTAEQNESYLPTLIAKFIMKDLEAITTPSEGPHPKPSLEKILNKKNRKHSKNSGG